MVAKKSAPKRMRNGLSVFCLIVRPGGGAPRQTDRRVCAAAKGVFFKKAEVHCKGGPFDKCTVRVEISVNLRKSRKNQEFWRKKSEFFAL